MLDPDSTERRAHVLQGRIQSLNEVSTAYNRLHELINVDASAEEIALAYAKRDQAFVRWLTEAGAEAAGELQLLAREQGMILPDDPAALA